MRCAVIRRLMTGVALAVVLAQRLIAQTPSCADCARYEVVPRDEVRDEDAGAVEADLGRIVGGVAEAQGNGPVLVTTTSARARALAADGWAGRVAASVERVARDALRRVMDITGSASRSGCSDPA